MANGLFHQILNLILVFFRVGVQIALLTAFFYFLFTFLRGTRAAIILVGVMLTTIAGWAFATIFQLVVLQTLLSYVPTLLAFALVIIFQPELRRVFAEIGSNPQKLFRERKTDVETIDALIEAAFYMRERYIGALIVIEGEIPLRSLAESGQELNAPVNSKLLSTIFYKGTPLHDGAVLIRGDTIVAAACYIPKLTENEVASELGTRHRAGLGITEESDAICIIVSEETGTVSIARHGRLVRDVERSRLQRHLTNYLIK
ncbi:MAG: TIGR00159 family protein, partial [Lentisphaerae bacterium]